MGANETQVLLDDLTLRKHSSVAALREAWAIDTFLLQRATPAEAAELGGITEDEFRSWLKKRGILHLLDSSNSSEIPEITVVLPVFNESGNINELYRRLVQVLETVAGFELIFVNNGSTDRSFELISDLQRSDARVTMICLSRNFGHQGALTAGIDQASGRAVILMDADLQDPPEILPEMIARWRKGAEVVYAVRQKRKDNMIKRAAYYLFYRLLKVSSDIDMPLDSGDFCLMDRVVVDHVKDLPEKSRFLRGLRAWVGFKQVPLYYERAARHAGESKYQFRHLLRFALEGLVSFSSMPLRIAAYFGMLVCVGGIGYLMFALIAHFLNNEVPQGWTSTVALILLLGGTQLVVLGVLGEYIARIYDESKRRPTYIVRPVASENVEQTDDQAGL